MLETGKINRLKVIRKDSKGFFLDGGSSGEIFLPRREVPRAVEENDSLDVFIYPDSDRRLRATTRKPLAMVGEFAWLRVASVDAVGAFMEWGIPKDLFAPFSEQKQSLKAGRSYIVYVNFDEKSGRVIASTKLHKYFRDNPEGYKEGRETDLLIYGQTETFYKVVVDNAFKGVLYKNEVFQKLHMGQKVKGYIKKVREDGKIDLLFHKPGYSKVNQLAKNIVERLEYEGGFLGVTDRSSPEVIYKLFGESKSTFKNAIGQLYKKKVITIEKDGIRLTD